MLNCTYLVSVARQNLDIMSINSALLNKYWTDCPYERIAVINDDENYKLLYTNLKYDKIIFSGRETNTITRIKYALENIDTPYVLLLHDDYLLYSPVNTDRVTDLLSYIIKTKAVLFLLSPNIPNYHLCINEEQLIREIPKGTAYRYNFQAGIWKKDFLLELLSKYNNIWDFERRAAFDKELKDNIVLQTDYPGIPYIESVGRGKWRPNALYMLANEGIYPDLKKRDMQSDFDLLRQSFKGFIFNLNREIITKFINLSNCGYKTR